MARKEVKVIKLIPNHTVTEKIDRIHQARIAAGIENNHDVGYLLEKIKGLEKDKAHLEHLVDVLHTRLRNGL